jgi:hypothetical protein
MELINRVQITLIILFVLLIHIILLLMLFVPGVPTVASKIPQTVRIRLHDQNKSFLPTPSSMLTPPVRKQFPQFVTMKSRAAVPEQSASVNSSSSPSDGNSTSSAASASSSPNIEASSLPNSKTPESLSDPTPMDTSTLVTEDRNKKIPAAPSITPLATAVSEHPSNSSCPSLPIKARVLSKTIPSSQAPPPSSTSQGTTKRQLPTLASLTRGILAKHKQDMHDDLVTIKNSATGHPSEIQKEYAKYLHELERCVAHARPYVQDKMPSYINPLSNYAYIDVALPQDQRTPTIMLIQSSGDSALDNYLIELLSYASSYFPPFPSHLPSDLRIIKYRIATGLKEIQKLLSQLKQREKRQPHKTLSRHPRSMVA